ncbi:hypothetical protein ACMU_13505 [Actibacterium mucosum KCTC 23349]|uniref:Calcineurin-like phosphoesterase domain-containing protein n=1 Tax=Actibacterium mucosum KCTC 23349 TaxID=1454373 RepID=A0A037ZHU1_9RHOB|nr:metallophosphoesterase family protein [Actibacterium mucosum]KAJ55698.1 hypothetical protein ACMU_13505 [Actibacterium mucosum KCTC 23349]
MRFPWFRKSSAGGQSAPSSVAAKRLNLQTLPKLTYAIGDVHGCLSEYKALEDAILADIDALRSDHPAMILLIGDIVDRGPHSAQLIDHLMSPTRPNVTRIVLRGNHEDMMLRFLDDPRGNMAWLAHGGRETLASYGAVEDAIVSNDSKRLKNLVASIFPPSHRAFLESLPVCLTVDRYVFCHAGFDPKKPMENQTAKDFMWSDPSKLDTHDSDWVCVHGHVPVGDVTESSSRIAIDTGAYATGRLSAVKLGIHGIERIFVANGNAPEGATAVDVKEMV